jgi:hypothetical protein
MQVRATMVATSIASYPDTLCVASEREEHLLWPVSLLVVIAERSARYPGRNETDWKKAESAEQTG